MIRMKENFFQLKKIIEVPRNPIFHATNSLIPILRQGSLQSAEALGGSRFGGTQVGISFSRNLSFLETWEFGNSILCFDRDELSNKYKIGPMQYGGASWTDEYEERVLTDEIPLSFLKVLIMKDMGALYKKEWSLWPEKYLNGREIVVVKEDDGYTVL